MITAENSGIILSKERVGCVESFGIDCIFGKINLVAGCAI
jgi:hypothetical protein